MTHSRSRYSVTKMASAIASTVRTPPRRAFTGCRPTFSRPRRTFSDGTAEGVESSPTPVEITDVHVLGSPAAEKSAA